MNDGVLDCFLLNPSCIFPRQYLSLYIWGNYTVVIMPPSFPWDGMEYPMITFASHTLITGDKSQVDVAIHEITHSWFGNDVGCQNWNHFWLNEGLNTFMERKVTAALRGEDFAKFEYFTGNSSIFAYYIETLIGEDAMQSLLRLYLSTSTRLQGALRKLCEGYFR